MAKLLQVQSIDKSLFKKRHENTNQKTLTSQSLSLSLLTIKADRRIWSLLLSSLNILAVLMRLFNVDRFGNAFTEDDVNTGSWGGGGGGGGGGGALGLR